MRISIHMVMRTEDEQVDWLPCEGRDPLLVSAKGLSDRLARLRVPQPDLSDHVVVE